MIHEKELFASIRALKRGGRSRSKYNAKRVYTQDGYIFDSEKEETRYRQLKLMEKGGAIRNLVVHPAYPIHWPTTGKLICVVELDFEYSDLDGVMHREDVKGHATALSKLKRKLVEECYHFKVEIIK